MGRGAITEQERQWALAYCGPARFNKSEAARMINIGTHAGRRMMNKPVVREYVETLLSSRCHRWELSARRWVEELLSLAYSDVLDLLTEILDEDGNPIPGKLNIKKLSELPPQVRGSVSQLKVKPDGTIEFRLHDKVGPLKLLGQYMRLLQLDQPLPPGAPDAGDVALQHESGDDGPRYLAGLMLIGPGAEVPAHLEVVTDENLDDGGAEQAGKGGAGRPQRPDP